MNCTPRRLLLSLAVLAACTQPPARVERTLLDHGAGAVVFPASLATQVRWLGDPEPQGTWTPSAEQVARLEAGLYAALVRGLEEPLTLEGAPSQRRVKPSWVRSEVRVILPRLGDYRRQYLGVIDDLGRRRIVARFFPGPRFAGAFEHPRWQEELVIVSDGGAEYWRIDYLPGEDRFLGFDSNGYA